MSTKRILMLLFPAVWTVAAAAAQSELPDRRSAGTHSQGTATDSVSFDSGHSLFPADIDETDPLRMPVLPAVPDHPATALPSRPDAPRPSVRIPGLHAGPDRGRSDNFAVWAGRQQAFYPGLGEYTLMLKGVRWQPFTGMTLGAAAVAGRQFFYRNVSGRHLFGTSVSLNYRITNDLQIHLRGQYLIRSGGAAPYLPPVFFPGSGAGGSMQYRVGNGVIEGGVQQRFDDNRKNWQTESSGKVSVSF